MSSSLRRMLSSIRSLPSGRPTAWRSALGCAAAIAVAALAGCAPPDKFAPACPGLSLLKDGADVTRFGPGGRDVTDMVLDARITAVPAKCQNGDGATVKATVQVLFDLTRGPAAPTRGVTLPYFVAVTRDGAVLDEQDYTLASQFPSNIDRISVSGPNIELVFPVTPKLSAAAYQIYVGFRLTPDQLAFNRRRGPR